MTQILDILKAANDLTPDANRSLQERPKRKPRDPSTTFQEKHRLSAIKKNQARIEEHRKTLHLLTSYLSTHSTLNSTNIIFHAKVKSHPIEDQRVTKLKIKKLQVIITRLETRLNHLKSGYNSTEEIPYKQGSFTLIKGSNSYQLLRGLVEYSFFPLLKFRTWNKELMLQENQYGKQFPSIQTHYARYKLIYESLKNGESIFLSARDGKWLLRRLERFERRLEYERATNYSLPKEINSDKQNDEYRRESHGQKDRGKFGTYDLEEITSPRPIIRLIQSFPCQLREDERSTLIQETKKLRQKLQGIYLCPKDQK